MIRRDWRWKVRCYYADLPNVIARETNHRIPATKDAEVRAAKSNPDYGKIVVIRRVRIS